MKGILEESFGLGIDMVTGRYKVVRLVSHPASQCFYCEIYSVGTTRWRCLGEAPFNIRYHSDPVFFNGAIHWLGVTRGCNQQQPSVFRFDIKDEKFGSMISTPNPSFYMHLYCLKECGGKLWLVFYNSVELYYEMWTRKDYLNDTWVKEYTFPTSNIPRFLMGHNVTDIVDGEIHFTFCEDGKWHVISYNPRSGAFRELFVGGEHGDLAFYKESLISPKKLSMYLRNV
ncbi:putative F-box protein At1g19160 [Asparagus officinalis]|uniref:putative F-box protein At1g19160 n=1 Tax=Asparagus officinalis TaxID=4686 RepID=UPI00098E48E5|nr:putative F-box protein At1g19160 [Asparagus officinalis]XP_020255296.1 putative F-box protein At1g19160 [Asparagus officinalis]